VDRVPVRTRSGTFKRAGGLSIAQKPEEAPAPAMPLNAVVRDHVDWVLAVSELPDVLVRLARGETVERMAPDRAP
jgi:chemotaxis response regulator CheB